MSSSDSGPAKPCMLGASMVSSMTMSEKWAIIASRELALGSPSLTITMKRPVGLASKPLSSRMLSLRR